MERERSRLQTAAHQRHERGLTSRSPGRSPATRVRAGYLKRWALNRGVCGTMSRNQSRHSQLSRFVREVKNGHWWRNARIRKQYEQSVWDKLISALFIPMWLGSTYCLTYLALRVRDILHPSSLSAALHNVSTLAFSLIFFPLCIASVFVGGFISNFVVYHIPAARTVLDSEAQKFPSTGYKPSQRAMLILGVPALLIAIVLAGVGALIG